MHSDMPAYPKKLLSNAKHLTQWINFLCMKFGITISFTTSTHQYYWGWNVNSSFMCLADRRANSQKQLRWKIYNSYHPPRGTFSFFTSCFRIAESRLKHNALQHGPRSLRRLARSSFRSKAAMLRAPSSCSKRLSASFNQKQACVKSPWQREVSALT